MQRFPFAVLLAVMAIPASVDANFLRLFKKFESDVAGEPVGDTGQLAIEHEELIIDLRQVNCWEPDGTRDVPEPGFVLVTVHYHILNKGAQFSPSLLFLTPCIEDGSIRLDGKPIASREVLWNDLDSTWKEQLTSVVERKKKSSPRYKLFDDEILEKDLSGLELSPLIGSGRHTLTVRYRARMATTYKESVFGPKPRYDSDYIEGDLTQNNQWRFDSFDYFLAPARSFHSFGTLHVTVFPGPGDYVSTTPEMVRLPDRLVAHFQGIPSEFLTVSASHHGRNICQTGSTTHAGNSPW